VLPLISTVFVASLLGSLHCAGMCGPLVAMAVGGGPGDSEQHLGRQLAYHGGRLLTYSLAGALAGALGAALELGGELLQVQQAAAILAGAVMVGMGAVWLLRLWGVGGGRPEAGVTQGWFRRLHRQAMRFPPLPRAGLIGGLTALLPCGWLYAFAVTAAGTGSPLWGALTMAAFWAGTVPILAGLAVGFRQLTGAYSQRLPHLTAIAIVVVGCFTIFGRVGKVHAMAEANSAVATPASPEAAGRRVQELDPHAMPCCQPPEAVEPQ